MLEVFGPILKKLNMNLKIVILYLCETWLTANVTDNMIEFPGFEIFRSDRMQAKRGGGLVIYI